MSNFMKEWAQFHPFSFLLKNESSKEVGERQNHVIEGNNKDQGWEAGFEGYFKILKCTVKIPLLQVQT